MRHQTVSTEELKRLSKGGAAFGVQVSSIAYELLGVRQRPELAPPVATCASCRWFGGDNECGNPPLMYRGFESFTPPQPFSCSLHTAKS